MIFQNFLQRNQGFKISFSNYQKVKQEHNTLTVTHKKGDRGSRVKKTRQAYFVELITGVSTLRNVKIQLCLEDDIYKYIT